MLWFMVLQIASTLVKLVQFRRTSSDEGEIHPLMASSRSFETVQRYGTCYTPAPVPCTVSTPPGAPAHQLVAPHKKPESQRTLRSRARLAHHTIRTKSEPHAGPRLEPGLTYVIPGDCPNFQHGRSREHTIGFVGTIWRTSYHCIASLARPST